MKVHQLLTRDKWLKTQVACDKHGDIVQNVHSDICCGWCLVGGIERCYPDPKVHEPILLTIARAVVLVIGGRDPVDIVCDWNDADERTWEEVHALLVRLDI